MENKSKISNKGDFKSLPEDWSEIKLDRVFSEKNHKYKKSEKSENFPILSMTRNNGLILQEKKFSKRVASKNLSNYKIVQNGEFVVGFPIDEGVIFVLKDIEKGIVSPAYTVWELILKEMIDVDFLDRLLKMPFMIDQYKLKMTHTVERRRYIKKEDFLTIHIPLPPLPEQHAIAHVLRTVQDAREKTKAVIEAAKTLKKSTMEYLFTYGPVPIDEADQVPLKETEIGMVPECWEIIRFSEIVEIVKGQIDPREEPYNKMLHIGPENILPETGQVVGMRTAEDIGLISGQYYFTSEHVIYSKIRPYLKKAAFPKIEGTCSADMYPLKPRDGRLSSEFLFQYLLCDRFSNDAISFQDRTGIPKINRQQLGLINLPLPKLTIQQKIANSLASIDKKIATEESRKAALDQLFQTLLHDLMTAKVRVNHISVPVAET